MLSPARASLRLLVAAAVCAGASGLLAPQAGLRAVAPRAHLSRSAVGPQMMLGGARAGRLSLRLGKMFSPSKGRANRFPGFGGSGGCGMSGAGGGGTSDATPASSGDDGKSDDESPLAKLWKSYEKALEAEPLKMKALTSLAGFAIGDILSQKFIQKTDLDWYRLFRLASFGLLVHGPSSHLFYGKLDARFPGTSASIVFTKVFIDQVLWNPIFGVMFFSYVAMLEGKGIDNVVNKVRNELLTVVTGSWKVWPLAHTINFRFVPSSQRVLYINSIQIGYNCFLSIISNRDGEDAAPKKKAVKGKAKKK